MLLGLEGGAVHKIEEAPELVARQEDLLAFLYWGKYTDKVGISLTKYKVEDGAEVVAHDQHVHGEPHVVHPSL